MRVTAPPPEQDAHPLERNRADQPTQGLPARLSKGIAPRALHNSEARTIFPSGNRPQQVSSQGRAWKGPSPAGGYCDRPLRTSVENAHNFSRSRPAIWMASSRSRRRAYSLPRPFRHQDASPVTLIVADGFLAENRVRLHQTRAFTTTLSKPR